MANISSFTPLEGKQVWALYGAHMATHGRYREMVFLDEVYAAQGISTMEAILNPDDYYNPELCMALYDIAKFQNDERLLASVTNDTMAQHVRATFRLMEGGLS